MPHHIDDQNNFNLEEIKISPEYMLKISANDLSRYVNKQVENIFPDNISIKKTIDDSLKKTLERAWYCFSRIANKYYYQNGHIVFDYQNTDQYAAFLYFLANTIWESSGDSTAAGKLYSLNKALHGIDVFYEVYLPDIFFSLILLELCSVGLSILIT